MRLVLSRKGFDATAGGMASPILPDGRPLSLPIPSRRDTARLGDLDLPEAMVTDLSAGRHSPATSIHRDPDLERVAVPPGWRPSLGQTGAAQAHLRNRGVGAGDVFLFFGWFRAVERGETWRFVPDAPEVHAIFGWLEVGEVVPLAGERRARALSRFPWIADHPHLATHYEHPHNTLYLGAAVSRFLAGRPGGGRFARPSRLTAPDATRRGRWALPRWFLPGDRPPLSHHGDPERWEADGDRVLLDTVGRGQEFVLDSGDYPELPDWVAAVVRGHG